MRDARDLARRLAARAPALAAELLPHGVREGQEWRVGSLSGERGRSLAVHLSSDRAGVWSDFSSGEGGDALDLVAARLYRGDIALAMDWARQWLGLSNTAAASPRLPDASAQPVVDDADAVAEAEAKRGSARRMWLNAAPLRQDALRRCIWPRAASCWPIFRGRPVRCAVTPGCSTARVGRHGPPWWRPSSGRMAATPRRIAPG